MNLYSSIITVAGFLVVFALFEPSLPKVNAGAQKGQSHQQQFDKWYYSPVPDSELKIIPDDHSGGEILKCVPRYCS